MSDRSIPRPPTGLGKAGRQLWTVVVRDYKLTPVELAALRLACEQADALAALDAAVAAEGVIVLGAAGQRRVNGAVGEARQARLALSKLLAELALPVEGGDTVKLPSPASQRQRRAVQSRWQRQRRLEAHQLEVAQREGGRGGRAS